MINSKTIREMNKSYNLYNILLSEKSKVYYNYIKIEEKIVSNNIRQVNSYKFINNDRKIEKPNKLINNSIEEDSNSPVFSNFIPKKINLGLIKFVPPKRSSKMDKNIDGLILNNFNFEKRISNEEIVNKSTKLEKRGLFKLVDKIVNIKMNEDTEEIIKRNILKLRKYCNKLRKPKKRIKKFNKQKTSQTPKSKIDKRFHNRKRMTMTDGKNIFKRKSLFENNNQDKRMEFKIKRVQGRISTTKCLNFDIPELDEISINDIEIEKEKKKEKVKEKENLKKLLKMTSSKAIKKLNYINKDNYFESPPNKRKIRKMQTLKDIKIDLDINKLKAVKYNKNAEINKNDESAPLISKNIKNQLLSSKFQRPPKYQFNNNNKNLNFFLNKQQSKSKFNPINDKNDKNASNREKKEKILFGINNKEKINKQRYSTRKSKRSSGRNFERFHFSKKLEKIKIGKISFDENENKIYEMDILSEFNRKTKI